MKIASYAPSPLTFLVGGEGWGEEGVKSSFILHTLCPQSHNATFNRLNCSNRLIFSKAHRGLGAWTPRFMTPPLETAAERAINLGRVTGERPLYTEIKIRRSQ